MKSSSAFWVALSVLAIALNSQLNGLMNIIGIICGTLGLFGALCDTK